MFTPNLNRFLLSPTGYMVTGPLPTGLGFQPTTGTITGTSAQTGTSLRP